MTKPDKFLTLFGAAVIAAVFGVLGSVAQTSFMRILDGNTATPALAGIQNGNTAGIYFGSGGGGHVGIGGSVGHLVAGSTSVPTLSSCGSAPAPVLDAGSNDTAGTYTTGGTATTCTITFNVAYATAPTCSLDNIGGSATQPTFTVSASAITVTVDIAQTKYAYICIAKLGG